MINSVIDCLFIYLFFERLCFFIRTATRKTRPVKLASGSLRSRRGKSLSLSLWMLTVSAIRFVANNLIKSNCISSDTRKFVPLSPPSRHLARFHAQGARFYSSCSEGHSMAPTTKTAVEYAKSGRSSCKKCSTAITKDAVRVGAVSRDSRGFDMTKWHHLGCFSFSSLNSVEAISGFSSLKVWHVISNLGFFFVPNLCRHCSLTPHYVLLNLHADPCIFSPA